MDELKHIAYLLAQHKRFASIGDGWLEQMQDYLDSLGVVANRIDLQTNKTKFPVVSKGWPAGMGSFPDERYGHIELFRICDAAGMSSEQRGIWGYSAGNKAIADHLISVFLQVRNNKPFREE